MHAVCDSVVVFILLMTSPSSNMAVIKSDHRKDAKYCFVGHSVDPLRYKSTAKHFI